MAVIESAAARLEEIVAMTCLSETDTELPDSWALWLDLWAQSVRHPEVARVREEFDAHWRETIASVVRDGIATGEFEKVDATRFAIMLSALLDGFAIQIALEDPAVDPQLAFRSTMDFAAMSSVLHVEAEEERGEEERSRKTVNR